MPGWSIPNAARRAAAERKAERLQQAMTGARSFKEAAWRAGIPVDTAKRLRRQFLSEASS